MKLLLASLVGSFALIVTCSTSASAQDARSLYLAADQYRDAIVHFEDEANRVRTIDRFSLRLIDRLEDQTSDLRSATRRVSDLSRVLYEFNEVQSLHQRVPEAVFASGCPIIRAALGPCWNEAEVAYRLLANEVRLLQTYAYRSGYRGDFGRPDCVHPFSSSPLNSPTFPNAYAPVPRVAPVPTLPPQASLRSPTPPAYVVPGSRFSNSRPLPPSPHDRFQSNGTDLGNAILGSLLSRVARGL
ncbi:hypothetical protein [Neorhodopirellula pilleata]|uniref:Uncharacterized protein n=1 Tax=Neorhodopirellula pilleata TaxID=2714738 RepID=A0A5C5ZXV2_9BACT|nr:hypothetical protein [Neorhodopirellula pilleata]TWT92482.1 hypothetical protein Pla100_45000 [Neorhodopirellula pilleata]